MLTELKSGFIDSIGGYASGQGHGRKTLSG